MRANKTQSADPERPIPYIVDLKADGTLIIGWDRKMMPPGNFSEIPPTKIAVEEGISIDDFRIWETRRWLQAEPDFRLETEKFMVYFANATDHYYERMQLIDALELRVTQADP